MFKGTVPAVLLVEDKEELSKTIAFALEAEFGIVAMETPTIESLTPVEAARPIVRICRRRRTQ